MEWIAINSAILFSAIAIIATVRANVIAEKARKFSKKVSERQQELITYKQRTQILEEIDRQQALLNRLPTITVKKISTIKQLDTSDNLNKKLKRLESNYNTINNLRSRYKEQRNLAYSMEGNVSTNLNERNLADIRRLTLHIEQEIENELDDS